MQIYKDSGNVDSSDFLPTLNIHVLQDNGTYEANEKQDLSTS